MSLAGINPCRRVHDDDSAVVFDDSTLDAKSDEVVENNRVCYNSSIKELPIDKRFLKYLEKLDRCNDECTENDGDTKNNDMRTKMEDKVMENREKPMKDLIENGDKVTEKKNELTENGDKLTENEDKLTKNKDILTKKVSNVTEKGDKLTKNEDGLTENNVVTENNDKFEEDKGDITSSPRQDCGAKRAEEILIEPDDKDKDGNKEDVGDKPLVSASTDSGIDMPGVSDLAKDWYDNYFYKYSKKRKVGIFNSTTLIMMIIVVIMMKIIIMVMLVIIVALMMRL